ncbi:hypothetical protein TSOC_013744 [Tetrabaena socialis]|uniref:Uncharacterized protein n=1 Tax=Tetrabaena socialis TaxID=47790 RepID=A0A2J7ZJI8_9CHLO|nr:hypothetical protein TSOC_013744 [Tetrabaena socialis]|eukprot:PNH00434.1 hypothetical protein TSOC_013744 [Tetrabaena socialis]
MLARPAPPTTIRAPSAGAASDPPADSVRSASIVRLGGIASTPFPSSSPGTRRPVPPGDSCILGACVAAEPAARALRSAAFVCCGATCPAATSATPQPAACLAGSATAAHAFRAFRGGASCPQTWNSIRNMTILLGQVLQLGALHTVGQQAGVHSRGGVLPERPPNPATGDQRGLSGGSHAQQEEAQLDAPGCNSAVQPGGPRRQPAPEAQSSEPQIRIAACTLRVLAILASRPGGDRFSMYANGASTPSTGAPPAAPRSPHKSVSPNVQCNPPVKSM